MNNKKPPTSGHIKMTQGCIRAIAHLNIGMQVVFPLALSFTPMMVARAETGEKKFFAAATAAKTIPYVLQPSDTLAQVAEKHHLTVAQLKTLNQYRTFAHGFESVSAGDEIDVPVQSKSSVTDAGSDGSAELAQRAQQAGNFLQNNPSSDSAKDLARGQALGAANSKANQEVASWLNGKGKARVKLDADRDFSLKNSELDVLYPLWENNAHQVFTQGSVHHTDSRNQSNLGLGYRYFEGTYMLGANTFFDHDWSRSHSRLGLGAEYQRDFLKVAANAYMRLTNWKNSPDFDNYEERPANGWDIRTEGYLPAYPGIGGKLVYEQYYGDRVGLFGKDNQQKNPVAVTAGINYSPFPLMKFNVDHRMGKSNQNDTRFGIDLNYVLGAPLSQQLDSSMLAVSRSLAANRYDFVDRNNNIVLEYRKKDTISLRLASQISGYSGESKSLGVSVNSTNGVERIDWSAPELMNHGGQIVHAGQNQYSVILPEFQYGAGSVNQYTVNGTAYDKAGNASPQASTTIIVTSAAVSAINSLLTPAEIVLPNDGQSTAPLTLVLQDNKGQPVVGVADEITMNITQSSRSLPDVKVSSFRADSAHPGTYLATLTAGTQIGVFALTPMIQNVKIAPATAIIGKMATIAKGALTTINNDAVANGVATNEVQAIVTNAFGKPVSDEIVTFSATNGAIVTSVQVTTNGNGIATTTLSSTKSGSSTVTATINNMSQTTEVNFVPDSSTASVASGAFTVTTNDAAANGSATNAVQVAVTDAHGNPVPNVAVKFSAPGDVKIGTLEATTNEAGIATSTMTSTKAGSYTITALVNGASSTADITFTPDSSTAEIASGAFTVTTNDAAANGSATNAVQVIVTDANGNPVPNVAVKFGASEDVKIGMVETTTNESGIATSTMTSTKAGSYEVTALVNGKSSTADITFIPDSSTAGIASGAFTVTSNDAVANGSATNAVQVIVTDANGNPVPNAAVNFSAPGDVKVLTATTITNESGIATSTMSSTKSGSYEVTAQVNGKSSKADVTFVPDSSTAEIASGAFTVTTNDAAANGSATNAVQVIVTDANGNPVPNVAVKFSASEGVKVLTATTTTNESGIATSTMTSTKAGGYEVTALVNGKDSTADITFIPDSSTAGIASGAFTVTTNNAAANGSATNAVQVIVTDANGNPVPNVAVNFSTSKDVKVGTAKATTNESGIATSTMTSTKAGSYEVTALVNGKSSTADITFIPDSSTAGFASGAFTVTSNGAVADGVETNQVKAIVTDANGNVVPGVEVTFSANNSAKVINSKVMTDGSGAAATTLTSTQVGSSTVTATANGKSQNVSVTFVVGAPVVAKSSLSATPMTIQADGTTASKLTLTLQDSFGRNVGGQTVAFVSSLNGSTVGTVKETSTGVYSADLTTVRSGSSTLSGSGKTTVTARVNNAAFNVSSLNIVINRYFVAQSVSNGNPITSAMVTASLNKYESILYNFRDGSWSNSVTLPSTAATGSAVKIVSAAIQDTTISYSGNTLVMNKNSNTPTSFLFNGSSWVKQ
ncbi:invasin domain 3-containing protein [Hafnia alvei]|uniref:Ig-like domain-containing protein n=3 Tax=Hafnia alvei TaxID=569 RepID=UPI002FFCE3C6